MAIIHDFGAIKAERERIAVREDDLAGELLRIFEGLSEGKQVAFMSVARMMGDLAQPAEPEPLKPPVQPAEPPRYLAALRQRVSAIIAEFDVPLPEGDNGLDEAFRRLHEMAERTKALYKEFKITGGIEEDEIVPHRDRMAQRFDDKLTDTEPQTLAGAATILRYLLSIHGNVLLNGADEPIENVLSAVVRALAGDAA